MTSETESAKNFRLKIGLIYRQLAAMQGHCLELLVDTDLLPEDDRLRWIVEDIEKLQKRIDWAKAAQVEYIAEELKDFGVQQLVSAEGGDGN
jgi:hypothetical protein